MADMTPRQIELAPAGPGVRVTGREPTPRAALRRERAVRLALGLGEVQLLHRM